MENNQSSLQNELVIDSTAHIYLRETAKWTRFFGVLGFIGSGIIVIASFFIGTIFSKMSMMSAGDGPNPMAMMSGALGGVLTVIYLLIGVLVFFISLFLFRFGTKMLVALDNPDQDVFNLSLKNLKNYFRIQGIFTLIYLGFIALAIVIGIIAIAFSHH